MDVVILICFSVKALKTLRNQYSNGVKDATSSSCVQLLVVFFLKDLFLPKRFSKDYSGLFFVTVMYNLSENTRSFFPLPRKPFGRVVHCLYSHPTTLLQSDVKQACY